MQYTGSLVFAAVLFTAYMASSLPVRYPVDLSTAPPPSTVLNLPSGPLPVASSAANLSDPALDARKRKDREKEEKRLEKERKEKERKARQSKKDKRAKARTLPPTTSADLVRVKKILSLSLSLSLSLFVSAPVLEIQ